MASVLSRLLLTGCVLGVVSSPATARTLVPIDGGMAGETRLVALSADGAAQVIQTPARLAPADTDSTSDLYAATAAGLQPLGPGRSNAPVAFVGASETATQVWFTTTESLLAVDTDRVADVYESSPGGVLRLISGGTAAKAAAFAAGSPDGSRVWFTTSEPLLAADRDAASDVYERALNGGLALVSGGKTGAAATFAGAPRSGGSVIFSTTEKLVVADKDSVADLYERLPDGSLRLVSGGAKAAGATFAGVSSDGAAIWFRPPRRW